MASPETSPATMNSLSSPSMEADSTVDWVEAENDAALFTRSRIKPEAFVFRTAAGIIIPF